MKKAIAAFLLTFSFLQGDVLFHKGDVALGVGLGSGSVTYDTPVENVTNDYFIFGVEVDYFFIDNLSAGMSVWHWSGDSPSVTQYTIPLTYYLDTGSRITPYGGVFYRYTDYSGSIKDRFGNSYDVDGKHSGGVRTGVAYSVSFGYLGLGVAAEKSDDSGDTSIYPEFSVGFVF